MKKLVVIAVLFMMSLQFHSCDDIDILSPPGPAGLSAYKEWVNAVKDGTIPWTSGTDLANFFKFLKGEKGDLGKSAYANWVELIKTGTVENPHKPGSKWDPSKDAPSDFYSFLTGAKGDAGLTPHINAAGNWQIGDKDTGIPAKGKDGATGLPGQPGIPGKDGSKVIINNVGNWEIDGADTGISAKGKDGVSGTDGKSAYEIWVEEVEAGKIKDKEGNPWPSGKVTLVDFWEYLSGTSVVEKEVTSLKFIKSEIDPTDSKFEIFDFETDPGAKVTMAFEHIMISEIANTSGMCRIRFMNSDLEAMPVLVTALGTGKSNSANLLVKVRARKAIFKFLKGVRYETNWGTLIAEGDGLIMDPISPPKVLGEVYLDADPIFVSMNNSGYAEVLLMPFVAENVKDIAIVGGLNGNFFMTVHWNEDGKGGYIRLGYPTAGKGWNPVRFMVYLQIASASKEITMIKMDAGIINYVVKPK